LRGLGLDVPQVLDEMIQRLLRKDPDDRYQSATAALADFASLSEALAREERLPRVAVGAEDRRRTLTEPAFTGREAELAVLEMHLEDARHGSGRLVIVEADSGGGKSRLLEELQGAAEGKGMWILRGEGLHQAAPRPLQVLAGVGSDVLAAVGRSTDLAGNLRHRLGDHRAALCEVLPELTEALGVTGRTLEVPEAYRQARGVEAVVRLLDILGSADRPALVVLDDCHWADELSVEVLARWAEPDEGDARHVLVVAAVVPEWLDGDHPLRTVNQVPRLRLPPLPDPDVHRIVESMAGPVPDEGLELVVRLAEGNPFMVTAVVRGLIESGAMTSAPQGWRFDPDMAGVQASRQAAALLGRRLELLDPPTRQLLCTGAALGRDFDLHLAAVLAGQSDEEARLAVAQAVERHFVWLQRPGSGETSAVPGRVAFVHSRLRGAFLEALTPDQLADLHLRAAEEIQATDPSRAFELAYHFDAAGEPERALEHGLSSAGMARARHDLELAERQYRIAERGLADADGPTRQRVAEALGQVLMLRGRYDEAGDRLELARSLARDEVSAASIDGQLGELAYKRGEIDAAAALVEQALVTLGEVVPRAGAALALGLGRELLRRGARTITPPSRRRAGLPDDEDAVERRQLTAYLRNRLFYTYVSGNHANSAAWWLLLRQLNEAERGPENRELAHAYAILGAGMTVMWPPLWRRGLRYTDRAATINERLGDLWGKGNALNMRGLALHAAGRYAEAADALAHAGALFERPGDSWQRNAATWNRALSLYRLGDHRGAVDGARQAHQGAVEIGDAEAEAMALQVWAKASGGMLPVEPIVAARGWSGGDLQGEVALLQAEALRLRAIGQPDQAITKMERADRLLRKSRSIDVYLVSAVPWLATLHREAAEQVSPLDGRARRRQVRRAQRSARRAVRYGCVYRNDLPHALRELGMTAALSGRPRRARKFLDRSAAVAQRQGAQGEYAETMRLRGRVGLEVGWPDAAEDVARAERSLPASALDGVAPGSLGLAERFSSLLDAGRLLTSASSSEEIAAAVREAALTLLRAEHCSVGGIESSNDDVLFRLHPPERHALVERAIEERRPVVLSTSAALPEDAPANPRLAEARSALCAPIVAQGEPVAYFLATHGRVAGLFGEQEQRLAEFIGQLAGAALEREALGQEMRARVVAAQEAERARVARDLHDEIGQAITSVLLGLRLVETSLSAPDQDLQALLGRLDKVRHVASEALGQVQRLAFELRPTVLDDLGLLPALRRLVDDISARYGVTVELAADDLDDGARLPPEAETTVYRVVQEALTNLGRHASASTCSVVLVRGPMSYIRVVVEDDGVGFDTSATPERGLGLRGMAERAALVGGNLRVMSTPGQGTVVVLEVPVG
jgi:signal transduction histidine kinase